MDALFVPDADAFVRYVHHDGRAPALVYLTGLGIAVAGTYDRCVDDPVLGAHRAVLVDVFGAGLSDAPATFAYSLDDHARTIAAVADHLGVASATVVAYSFGGAVAITLAAARPDLVSRLVLAEPNLDPGGGFLSRRIAEQPEDAFVATGFAALVADADEKARRGDRSWADPREAELRAAGIRLLGVAAADHGMPWQNPDGFVAAVRAAAEDG